MGSGSSVTKFSYRTVPVHKEIYVNAIVTSPTQEILVVKPFPYYSPFSACQCAGSRAVHRINMFTSDSFEEQKSKHVFIMYLSDDPFSGSGQKMTPAPQH